MVTNDIEELVEKAEPDALMVLVSEDQMRDMTARALTFGLPVFVEKPAGLAPADNEELAQIAADLSVPSMVGFNRRFYSIFHKGLEVIREHGPLLGVMVEGHERMWRIREGGKFDEDILEHWIYANSVHTIDLLRFFGGEPSELHAIAHSLHEKAGDQFAAVMELESGAIGQYSAHWYSPGGVARRPVRGRSDGGVQATGGRALDGQAVRRARTRARCRRRHREAGLHRADGSLRPTRPYRRTRVAGTRPRRLA